MSMNLIIGTYSLPILREGFSWNENCGENGSHATSSVSLSVRPVDGFLTYLMTAEGNLSAVIKDGSTVVFSGVVRPYTGTSFEGNYQENISLEIMDYTEAMHIYIYPETTDGQKTGCIYPTVYQNKTLSDMVGILFGLGGKSISSSFTSTESIPYFKLEGEQYLDDVISELLFEYGYDYKWNAEGKVVIFPTFIDSVTVGTISDVRGNFSISRSDDTTDGLKVTWREYEYQTNVPLYSFDSGNQTFNEGWEYEVGSLKQLTGKLYSGAMHDSHFNSGATMPSGNLWTWNFPDLSRSGKLWEMLGKAKTDKAENTDSVLFVETDSSKISVSLYDEDGVTLSTTLESYDVNGMRMYVDYSGIFNVSFGTGWTWKVNVRGNIGTAVKSEASYNIIGANPDTKELKYRLGLKGSSVISENLVKQLYLRSKFSKISYSFSSLTSYDLGGFYTLEGNTIRIVSKVKNEEGIYTYRGEGAKAYSGVSLNVFSEQKGNNKSSSAKSAYDIAVDNGYTGSEEEWLASLDGVSTAYLSLYKRVSSAPSAYDGGTITYTFETGVMTGSFGTWSTSIPSGDETLYVISMRAKGKGESYEITSGEWSVPAVLSEQGSKGEDGKTVVVVNLYQRGSTTPATPADTVTYDFSDNTVKNAGSWSQSIPDGTAALWCTQATAVGNGTNDSIEPAEWSTPKKVMENGSDGKGIVSVTTLYATSPTQTQPTSFTLTSVPTLDADTNKYLWKRETTTYTSGNPTTVVTLAGVYGDTGKKGDTGTSVTITGKSVQYASSTSGTTTPADSAWKDEVPSVSAGSYLWTRTIVTYSDSNSTTAYSVAYMGKNGADGKSGTSPKLTSQSVAYQNSSSGTTIPTDTTAWKSTATPTQGQYTWTRTTLTYSDSTTAYTYSVSYTAKDGEDGEKGQSLTSATEQYATSTSTTTAPDSSSFSDTKPEVTSGNYLWRRLKLVWANPTATTYTTATLVDTVDTQTPYIRGTQTASTNAWTGNAPTIAALYSGLTIRYYLPYGASSNVTLNLTLKDGTTTGAIYCYYGATTRLTSHYGAGSVLTLTYLPKADNKTGYDGWFCTPQYYSYDNYNNRYNNSILAKTAVTQYALIGAADETGYFNVVAGSVISTKYPLLMAGSAIAASKTNTNAYIGYYSLNLAKNVSGLSFTTYKPVYVKGVYSADGTFTVDSTTPFTQTEPTTADGNSYIRLGIARSGTAVCFEVENKIWNYANGVFCTDSAQLYDKIESTRSDLQTEIDTANGEIALRVKVSGSATDGTGQLVVGSSYIKLNAPQILVDGSVTAQQIDTDSLMAQTLTVKDGGKIQSENYDPEADAEGFSLSSSGILQANKAVLNDVKITKGELDAPSLKTLNAQQSGSWSATGGFPAESGTGTHAVKVVKTGETSGTSVGTLTTTHTPTGYYKGKDFAQWCLDNIPVNNDGFTKLDGSINGYNVYAARAKGSSLYADFSGTYTGNAQRITVAETTISCGRCYKYLACYCSSSGVMPDYWWVTLDGEEVITEQAEGVDNLSVYELPPGDHTIKIELRIKGNSRVYTCKIYTGFASYGIVSTSQIELRLYPGDDDSIVFEGGRIPEGGVITTPQNDLVVIHINGGERRNRTVFSTVSTSGTYSDSYESYGIDISYNGSSLICGTGLTGWTLTRYEKFLGLYEVGKKNDSTGNVEWVSAPALRENGIYKSTAVYIDGTLYQKEFTISWSGTILSVVADDGSVSKVYSTDNYYTDFSTISFCELAYDVGTYVSDLFPMSESSNVGSVSQPFNEIHATNINVTGNITGNVKGNVTGDTTGTHIGNVNGDSSGVNANAASYVVWGAVFN